MEHIICVVCKCKKTLEDMKNKQGIQKKTCTRCRHYISEYKKIHPLTNEQKEKYNEQQKANKKNKLKQSNHNESFLKLQRERSRLWYHTHKEQRIQKIKKYQDEHQAEIKQYYQNNKENILKKRKEITL